MQGGFVRVLCFLAFLLSSGIKGENDLNTVDRLGKLFVGELYLNNINQIELPDFSLLAKPTWHNLDSSFVIKVYNFTGLF